MTSLLRLTLQTAIISENPEEMTTVAKASPPSFSALARENDVVTVDVGPENQKFHVYTKLLTSYSDYFAKTLSGDWKEAQDRTVQLPDIEPRVFELFIDWLYTQKLPTKRVEWVALEGDLANLQDDCAEHNRLIDMLQIKTYIFADRFLIPGFRCALHNSMADVLVRVGNPPYYDMIIYAFDNLPPKSKMLSLLVRMHCEFWNPALDKDFKGELRRRAELPYEFLMRSMICYGKRKNNEDLSLTNVRSCHDHACDEDRQACEGCMGAEEEEEDYFLGVEEEDDVEDGKEGEPQVVEKAWSDAEGPV
ncbi:hypothetical protein CC80DRAFT_474241 [Byssothecium circinans]|uniref:BTB domain-containing protein n=1 Tax=Byssothecium circinans TaxID=147558 RepID=A0A6A5U2W0_9PLEO|nr:hypothetical protein CC80DRAFT_474241 [Byssothecium circinans]